MTSQTMGNRPSDELNRLARKLKGFEDEEAAARDWGNLAIGSLNNLSADGIYTKLSRCEEQIADLNAKIESEKLRMDSIRLLFDTVNQCKASMVASVLGPIEQNASKMLSRIAGSKLGSIQLDEAFVPKGIKPGLAMREVDLCNLSGGEQEQLFLVTRLAMGQLLAKGERQLVVLDDVLNATDTDRLSRLLALMEEAADHLHIVILTCHPERISCFRQSSVIPR